MAVRPLLVIEDDAATAEFITNTLADDGYAIEAATSVRDARRLLEAHGPDGFRLVICDSFSGPSSDMFAWLDQVRTLTTAPVVITSAHPENVFMGWEERGFGGVLPKPFDLGGLTALVVGLCGQPEQAP